MAKLNGIELSESALELLRENMNDEKPIEMGEEPLQKWGEVKSTFYTTQKVKSKVGIFKPWLLDRVLTESEIIRIDNRCEQLMLIFGYRNVYQKLKKQGFFQPLYYTHLPFQPRKNEEFESIEPVEEKTFCTL